MSGKEFLRWPAAAPRIGSTPVSAPVCGLWRIMRKCHVQRVASSAFRPGSAARRCPRLVSNRGRLGRHAGDWPGAGGHPCGAVGRQPAVAGGRAAKVVVARPGRRPVRRAGAALRRAVRLLDSRFRRQHPGAGHPHRRIPSRLHGRVHRVGRGHRAGRLERSRSLQPGAAAGGAGRRPAGLQHAAPAALARCRVPGGVLHQDRHRAAGRDPAPDLDRHRRPGRHRAGGHRLAGDVRRHLRCGHAAGAGPPPGGHAGRRRRRVRRIGRHRRCRGRGRPEGTCADRHHHRRLLGDRDDLPAAPGRAGTGAAHRRRRARGSAPRNSPMRPDLPRHRPTAAMPATCRASAAPPMPPSMHLR